METTLKEERYMGIEMDASFKLIQKMNEEVSKFNGTLSFLWHNHYISEYKYGHWKDLLTKIIKLGKERNIEFKTGEGIYNDLFPQ